MRILVLCFVMIFLAGCVAARSILHFGPYVAGTVAAQRYHDTGDRLEREAMEHAYILLQQLVEGQGDIDDIEQMWREYVKQESLPAAVVVNGLAAVRISREHIRGYLGRARSVREAHAILEAFKAGIDDTLELIDNDNSQ